MYTSMFRKAMLGDTATLNLDFTTGTLDSRLTFTRASTATYINSSGYVTTMGAAPTNDPTKARFDYDPVTLAPRGLLIEGTAINLTTYSDDFANVNWTKDNSGGSAPVVTTVSATNPANGSTVNQIVFDKTGGVFSRIGRTSTGTASTPYTMSVWMRTASGSANVGLRIGADSAGFNCAVTTTWKRFQYTYTLSSTDSSAQIMLWDNIIGNDETATVYAWGCQVEAGSGASSYIPTVASQVTRNADACSMTGSNFTNVFGDGSLGTIICSHEFPRADRGLAHQPTPFAIGNYVAANARGYSYASYSAAVSGYGWVYTSASFGSATTSAASAAKNKCGIAYNGLAITAALNGTTASATGTGTITVSSATGLLIGYNATPRDFINACVSNIRYYPTRLTNAELQALTAP